MRDTVLLNLHLVNFKNHSELELAFSPGLNAFVGQNGAGKTAGNSGSALQLRLMRDTTEIVVFESLGGFTNSSLTNLGSYSTVWFDSPATTSATIYKTQFRNVFNGAGVEAQGAGLGIAARSTICLMEVSA
jgi:hypothetical protein